MFLQTVHVLEIPTLYKILNEIKENFSFSPSTPYAVSRASCDLHLKSFYNSYNFYIHLSLIAMVLLSSLNKSATNNMIIYLNI